MENPSIIDNKLKEDLHLRRIVHISTPPTPFISSPLGLIPKQNGGFKQIYHLSHPKGGSVNNYIPDGAGELR